MERLEEVLRRPQLPPTISMGFLNVIDATGRYHPLSMNMARSFKVSSCISSTTFLFYLLNYEAI